MQQPALVCIGCNLPMHDASYKGIPPQKIVGHFCDTCWCCSHSTVYGSSLDKVGLVCVGCCSKHRQQWLDMGILDDFVNWVNETREKAGI